MTQSNLQAVVTPQSKMLPSSSSVQIALFNADGTPFDIVDSTLSPAAAVPNSVATTISGLVSDFNALLISLRAAGHLTS